jgi:nitrite reductase/ring-hydroxylating ferredoxin subunit/multimeric flavodoxin WrbA
MSDAKWQDLGPIKELKKQKLQEIHVGKTKIALSYVKGKFGAISGVCNHVGGPLGKGEISGEYVVCPWHHYKFHCKTGFGEPGYEDDRVPQYELKEEKGRLLLNLKPVTTRNHLPHKMNPVGRPVKREAGPVRVAGISTTAMDPKYPRYSTSEVLLQTALEHAEKELNLETRFIRLNDLKFRNCEGYYSKSAHACIWPCSITEMDKTDQMDQVYEAVVHWADVLLVATPIRWGSASSLYYKMVERMNCIQNQITIHNKFLIQNKVASFIITGGQDNIQAVAGQMLGFFSELGFVFPPYPYIATSRGWTAEDMERNMEYVANSDELREGSKDLVCRAVDMAKTVLETKVCERKIDRAGRKAHSLKLNVAG